MCLYLLAATFLIALQYDDDDDDVYFIELQHVGYKTSQNGISTK
jgi:hypothetical protein